MFYTTEEGHPLKHNPLSAIVTPRPIAWISTRSADGVDNIAPYSFFNLIAYQPAQVMFASTQTKADQARSKDTVSNIEATGVFCINVAEFASRDKVNTTSAPFAKLDDEFKIADIEKLECNSINAPRVANAPAALECEVQDIIDLPGESNLLVLGHIKAIHIRDDCIIDGRFDVTHYKPLTRLGYQDYGMISETFRLARPK